MAAMVNMNSLLNGKDSRWLQLEVCREFQRNKCSRQDTECKFAHPPANVEVQNGKVTACYDSIKGRCNRDKPPCKYFHPPQHLKDQLLINGRNHLALKNALMQQMGIAPGQPVMPGQVQTVATNPYLTGIPANTYSPYFGPGHLVPAILGPDPSAVASQLGPVVSQAVPVAQQKLPRSDRLEVCREFMRSACKRAESECRFAHPQESVTTHEDGSVTVCMDAVKGRCARDPCRYFHPPLHLQAQIKAAQSRATATAPVSAATLTHPIQTPGAAPPPNAVAIGHPLEVGKKRAAENDMFQLAFSGMVPFKRPAGEKSGIPVYQPGATTYQQLMQLQQPFVPVSCEYQSQNPSATTANPQPQTSNTANPIIANNSSNNHSIINNNFIFNNLNHLKNNSKISQVNLNTVHNNIASNGMLSISNLNSSSVMIPSSTKTSDVVATKIIQSNSSNGGVVNSTNGIICSVNNNNIGSNTSDSSLVSNLTNKAIQDSIPSTLTAQTQSSINNALASTFVSNSPTISTATTLTTSDSTQTNSVNVSTTTSSPSAQTMLSQSNLSADSPILNGENTPALTDGALIENATNTDTSLNPTISAEVSSTVNTAGSSLINTTSFNNTDTLSNINMTTAFPTSTEQHLKPSLTKYEPQNNNQSITTVASSADISFSVQNSASISFPTSTQSRIYSTPHSYANVIVSHHGYTPVSSVTSSAIPITYSSAPSTYNYTSFPTQSYPTQSYQAQCYPTNSYYADPASIAKEVAQKNYANAVKMAAASNALSGKPLTAAINYTGLPLNKTYVTQNPGAVAFSHHHQQQQAAAAAAAQAVQVAGLRMNSHGVGGSLGNPGPGPSSTPSLLPRPPTGYLPASSMMRTQPISMSTAAASNPYAAAAAAAAAANQQYLQQQQQQQQHYFFPGMMAGYPYPFANAPGVPGLTSASGIHGMPAQIQAAQMAQMNQAAAAAAQLLDTLPVCQDFNRSMCSRLNCRFVHLTEDDKVEVCDQRVAVCRDHANGQCRRKLCKYYHIPVVLPPANIMATIFNQQPAQQPLHHPNPLGAATTISLNEQKQQEQLKQQQLIITTNASSGTTAPYTSISSHHNNNNILSSLSNNTIYKNINEKKNTVAPYQSKTLSPTTLLRQVSSSTSKPLTAQQNFTLASPQSPKSISEPSNIYALTTSTSTMSTPVMTTSSNLSTAAIAHVYTPTFEGYFNAQQHLAPAFGYYDILNQGVSNSDSHRISVLSSNPTYIAAPLIYTSKSVSQPQHHDTSGETNTPNANISNQHQHHSSVSNLPEIITTSTI